jgi:hypothetical protein
MLKHAILLGTFLVPLSRAIAQAPPDKNGVPVDVVAMVSDYVPRTRSVSTPGHAYTNCSGRTSYFGQFNSYGQFGTFSGSGQTDTQCRTTFTPPTETELTTYYKVNYTVVRGENALYLVSCTQTWKHTAGSRAILALMGGLEGGSGSNSGATDRAAANAKGTWTPCPAFAVGSRYTLILRSTSDARLEDGSGGKPVKLDYLASAPLPAAAAEAVPAQTQAATSQAKVHITSSLPGAEIYIDGKFYGNSPSDITLTAGQHIVKVTAGGKEWSRTVQITSGEINLHADFVTQ